MSSRKNKNGAGGSKVAVGFVVAAACVINTFFIITLTQFKTVQPLGVFEAVGEEEFYIEFFEDGTYRESVYNMPRPFISKGSGVTMYDAAGEATYFDIVKSHNEQFVVHLNGRTRVMRRSKDAGEFFNWESAESEAYLQDCEAAYVSNGAVKSDFTVKLFTDQLFIMSTSEGRIFGKYAITSDKTWLLLFTNPSQDPIKIKQWEGGLALSPLSTSVTFESVKENVLVDRGYSLLGSVYDEGTGTSYEFMDRNLVLRKTSDAPAVEMLYFVDLSGFVSMVDSAGAGTQDSMWFDTENNLMYRHVLENDKWYEYLNNAGSLSVTE